jgi:hypothetical protein
MRLQVFQSGVANKQAEQDRSIAQDTIFKSVTSNNCLREVKLRTGFRSAGHIILILMEA